MQNPEFSNSRVAEGGITVRKAHWDFPEYKTPSDYPGKQVKAGIQKATKKGFYMDYMIKVSKGVPSAQHYKTTNYWSEPKQVPHKKNLKSRRMSYIDEIELEHKRKKAPPGIGAYKLIPTEKEIEAENKKLHNMSEKRENGEKRFFHEDIEYVANIAPGPGNYNPHSLRKKQSMNKTDPHFWKNKHSEELKESIRKNKIKPDPALYKPLTYGTFEDIERSTSKKVSSKPWGSETRFTHYEKSARTNPNEEKRPSHTTYNLDLLWKGKFNPEGGKSKSNDKRKDWLSATSKPRAAGIYN